MRVRDLLLFAAFIFCASCSISPDNPKPDAWNKVELNLLQLDSDGLRGPPDGKVSVSYEFCIPDNKECRATVKAIDSTIQFMPGSRGRIGAGSNECLCIGSTKSDYRKVLGSLSELSFVKRIIECHFE